jgi:hypothetical protein
MLFKLYDFNGAVDGLDHKKFPLGFVQFDVTTPMKYAQNTINIKLY